MQFTVQLMMWSIISVSSIKTLLCLCRLNYELLIIDWLSNALPIQNCASALLILVFKNLLDSCFEFGYTSACRLCPRVSIRSWDTGCVFFFSLVLMWLIKFCVINPVWNNAMTSIFRLFVKLIPTRVASRTESQKLVFLLFS